MILDSEWLCYIMIRRPPTAATWPDRMVPYARRSGVEVTLPVDVEAAKALSSPARREAAGRYLSGLLTGGLVHDVLAEAIAEAKREARASGLTDEDIDTELEAWRAGRKA